MPLKKLLFPLIILLTVAVSCNKTAKEGPLLTIEYPYNDTLLHVGDTVRIRGIVSDSRDLHELNIKLYSPGSSQILFWDTPVVHNLKSYSFDYFIHNLQVVPATPLKVRVEVSDHDGHTAMDERELMITQ